MLSTLLVTGVSYSWTQVLALHATFGVASTVCAAGSLAVARLAVRHALPDRRWDTGHPALMDDKAPDSARLATAAPTLGAKSE